jgi:hypothetical protein
LPSIHEDRVYIGKLMYHSALQGVALQGKISHIGCGTVIGRQDRISKTRTPTTQNISRHDLSSVVIQLQRVASDQAALLKKLKETQEKQDRHARRAARKAKKDADAMMSMIRDFLKSHSTGSQKKKKSSGINPPKAPTEMHFLQSHSLKTNLVEYYARTRKLSTTKS